MMSRLIAFVLLMLPLLAHSADPNWIYLRTLPNGAISSYDMNNSYYKDGYVHVLMQLKYSEVQTIPFMNVQWDKLIGFSNFSCDSHSYTQAFGPNFHYLNDREVYQSDGVGPTLSFAPGSYVDQTRTFFCSKFKHWSWN